jgi:hypothetical protein
MRFIVVLVAIVGGGCLHAQPPALGLEQSLRLEVTLEATQPAAVGTVRVRSVLRNVSRVAVEVCQLDGDVTIAAIVGERLVPLRAAGAVFDAPCYNGGTIGPGAIRAFESEVSMWPGTTAVIGWIRVHRPGGSSSEIRSQSVRVPTASG